jgi:hypothetical protein
MRYLLTSIPLITILSLIFYFNRPRCYTCLKRKFQMNFTDKLDCMSCYAKQQQGKANERADDRGEV